MIHGMTVKLSVKTQTGTDDFGRPEYSETQVSVDNVIVAPLSESEILETLNLTGSRAIYQLGIPKGDTHSWTDTNVEFFGQKFHTIGAVQEGIEDMIPLSWNKKVRVELIR